MMTILATAVMTYTLFIPTAIFMMQPRAGVYDEGNHRNLYAPLSRVVIPASWSTGVPPHLAKTAADYWTMAALRGPVPEDKRANGMSCSPPSEQAYQDYANFALEIATTGVAAIEIGNEPNVGVDAYPFIGCWGEDEQAGRMYGDLVRVVYDTVKPAYTDTQIIAGALIMLKNDFVPGMLASAGGHYDAVSFHGYTRHPDYDPSPIVDYAAWLRQYTDRPLVMPETAVISDIGCDETYQARQVEHWHWLAGFDAVDWFAWYTIAGNGWPVDCPSDMYPNPVYYEYLSAGSVQ